MSIVYETANKESHKPAILKLLCDEFLHTETMNVALSLTLNEFLPVAELEIDKCLEYPCSFVAKIEGSDTVVGVILNAPWRRPVEEYSKNPLPQLDSSSTPMTVIGYFLSLFSNSFWLLAPPDVHCVLQRHILCVHRDFQRRGIASRLEGIQPHDVIKSLGIDGFASKTSSLANQKLMEKKGYRALLSVPYDEIRDEKGEALVKATDGTTHNIQYYKNIDE